jgi:uncharacterized protein YuzE
VNRPQRVTCEHAGSRLGPFYLYYAEGVEIGKTESVTRDHTVAIDLGAAGEVVGVEVLGLGAEELVALARISKEHDLSLNGFLELAAASFA